MLGSPRSRRRFRDGSLALLGLTAIGVGLAFALYQPRERPIRLRMTAGQVGGTRHRIAEELGREAVHRGLVIDLRPTVGSEEALLALEAGRIALAMVQGGLETDGGPVLRQVAAMHVEPLHLLVKQEIHGEVARNLAALRRKVIHLGEPGSGTRVLSGEVLALSGLQAERDFVVSALGHAELERATDPSGLPDAVFTVSTLPPAMVRRLVTRFAYRLVPLPFLEAFTLAALDRDESSGAATTRGTRVARRHIHDATIPAFVYEIDPGVPPEPIHTLGTRLLLVARRDLPSATVRRLLDVVFNSSFAQVIHPPLDVKLLELPPERPWHDGTIDFVRRTSPLIIGEVIDLFEKEVSIAGVLAGGIFGLVQWLRRRSRWRRERGFEAYILEVAAVERRGMELSRAPTLDLAMLLQLQEEVARIKGEALQRFADGELDGEALMSGFLAHVSDVRDFLVRLILHQRDNLEDQARAQRRRPESLWVEALGGSARAACASDPEGPPPTGPDPRDPDRLVPPLPSLGDERVPTSGRR